MRFLYYLFLWILSLGALGALAGVGVVAGVIMYYSKDLPAYNQLKEYAPPIVTRLYASNGGLMQEYAREKRVFVPIEQIPARVKNAFIAAEDKNFYSHEGVDPIAIARAMVSNLRNLGSNKRPEGASTISQQVVKNFLLTSEVSYERKVKEAILAYRLERALGKEQILELYLNQIYMGGGSYGVAAAGQNYFNKPLEELSVAEVAYLGGLPKAPSDYHPVRRHDAALARRNYVINRMYEDGYITKDEETTALAEPLKVVDRNDQDRIYAPYFAEEVRRELEKKYGEDQLYGGGFSVHTPVDPRLQDIAVRTLRDGLMGYDKRHGWRGALGKVATTGNFVEELKAFKVPEGILPEWRVAVITASSATSASLMFADGRKGTLAYEDAKWTGKESIAAFLSSGDVIAVERTKPGSDAYKLQQIPAVQGALVAIDPNTGRVLAMQGGWRHGADQFNRATQAVRQPGSAFKPFIYLTALEKGFTPATLVLDAPFRIEDRPGHFWSPKNYSNEFYGPTPLRVGVEKSRNLMTVRLADYVGMDEVVATAARFGISDKMPNHLSGSLGSVETTLLKLTSAYAMIANGGKKVEPTFIDRIQDRYGHTVYQHDKRECPGCGDLIKWENQDAPQIPDTRAQIADPRVAYQMTSILEGVIQRGTGVRIKGLKWPLAGKTGTTNDSKDTWFIGYSPDLVVGVFVGFDEPKPMGKRETGASVALPVFGAFMEEALKDTPPMPFRIPNGIRQVRIDAADGTLATATDSQTIWESFVLGTEPDQNVYMLDGTGQIRRLPSYIYRDNYITMQDQYMDATGQGSVSYTDRYTGTTRESATSTPSTGTGGLY